MSKTPTPKFSQSISDICKMFDDAKKDYDWSGQQVVEMDRLTQDYLHKLELEDLSYGERAKVATALRNCRKLRREHKDTTEILEPLVSFLETDKGKNLNNLLKECLGKTRKAEDKMQTRVYHPRVLQN